jgi:hypothetical protein
VAETPSQSPICLTKIARNVENIFANHIIALLLDMAQVCAPWEGIQSKLVEV